MVLFVDNIILNIEIPKECTKNLLGLMNNFNTFVGCNINIQKSVAFLYANNELFKKLRQQPYLQLHKKIIIYLEINLTKEVKYLSLKTVKH